MKQMKETLRDIEEKIKIFETFLKGQIETI